MLSCPMACGILVPRPGSNPYPLHWKVDSFFFFLNYLFFYLRMCWVFVFCARAFSSCGKRGSLFIAVRGPLTIAASLVAGHRLQTRRLSSCGSWAQPLRGMWDLPRPGLEPVSPALADRFSTTAPPGKPGRSILNHWTTREVPGRFLKSLVFGSLNFLWWRQGTSGGLRRSFESSWAGTLRAQGFLHSWRLSAGSVALGPWGDPERQLTRRLAVPGLGAPQTSMSISHEILLISTLMNAGLLGLQGRACRLNHSRLLALPCKWSRFPGLAVLGPPDLAPGLSPASVHLLLFCTLC